MHIHKQHHSFLISQDRPSGYRNDFQGNGNNDNRNSIPIDE